MGSNKNEKRKPKSAVYRSFWASVVYFHLRLISTKNHKGEMTRNQFDSNVTWVRIPPSAPKAAPCGALLFIFAANYARAARWDSNSPRPALCVPPGCNSPADCCKGAGESHRLRQRQHPAGCCFLFLQQTMQGRGRIPPPAPSITTQFPIIGSDFYCRFVKFPYFSYKQLPFIFK